MPADNKTTSAMYDASSYIDVIFNGKIKGALRPVGFVLLAFNKDDATKVNYSSNCERRDMIVAMKEILARMEGQPAIIGHS